MTRYFLHAKLNSRDTREVTDAIGYETLANALRTARDLRRTHALVWMTNGTGATLYSHADVSAMIRAEDKAHA